MLTKKFTDVVTHLELDDRGEVEITYRFTPPGTRDPVHVRANETDLLRVTLVETGEDVLGVLTAVEAALVQGAIDDSIEAGDPTEAWSDPSDHAYDAWRDRRAA